MSQFGSGILRPSARPIKICLDKSGEVWLCDADVDGSSDLASQGCVPSSSNPQND